MEQKFNKFLTTMLAVVLLATTMLVGCGENTPVNSTNTPATTTSTTFIYTVAPTDEITVEPTEEITETPAAEATEDPTEKPTMEPTANPTEEPTESPTEKPTEAPTSKPTQTPDVDVTFEDINSSYYNIIIGEPGTSSDVVAYANKYWNDKVPDWLKMRFVDEGWDMVVSAIPLGIRYGYSVSLAGITNYGRRTIFLDNRKPAVKRRMIHELGHFTGCINGFPRECDEFFEIFELEKSNFVDCMSTGDGHEISNTEEYFASVFCNIILNRQNCQEQVPRSYEFVSRYMH